MFLPLHLIPSPLHIEDASPHDHLDGITLGPHLVPGGLSTTEHLFSKVLRLEHETLRDVYRVLYAVYVSFLGHCSGRVVDIGGI